MATTPAGRGEMTLEQFLENVERGILDVGLDAFVPLDLFGPPTEEEQGKARLDERLVAHAESGANEPAGPVTRPAAPGASRRRRAD